MKVKTLILLFIFLFDSCDKSKPFVIEEQKLYTLYSQCGTIVIRGSSFSTSVMVACTFNGKYHINTDSLRIKVASIQDTLTTVHFQLNNAGFLDKKIETKKGETLSFNFNLLPIMPYQKTTGTIFILPSKFIMCEDKAIITDTIKISLK